MLGNYAQFNMTATIICPLFHGWTSHGRLTHHHAALCICKREPLQKCTGWCTNDFTTHARPGWTMQYGRHNHGAAYTNDPWSGYYELSAAFWIQAQVTRYDTSGRII